MTKQSEAISTPASVLSEVTARPWHIYRGRDLDKVWQKNITVASYVDGEESGDVAIAQCHFNTRERSEANAALIVRAVNNHDALVKAHEENIRLLSLVIHDLQGCVEGRKLSALNQCVERSRAALTGAK